MGGTCVIRGCVPKKLMVFASEYPKAFARRARLRLGRRGAAASTGRRFRAQLDAELDRLEGIYRRHARQGGRDDLRHAARDVERTRTR